MTLDLTIQLTVLIAALGMQVSLHSFWFIRTPGDPVRRSRAAKKITATATGLFALAMLGIVAWRSWLLYQGWKANPLSKFLLPPYTSFKYFVGYIGAHFLASVLVAMAAAVLGGLLAALFNRRYNERFFENEEPYFFALGILSTGYPGFFLFMLIMFTLGVLWTAWCQLFRNGRAPLYYLWFPAAILAILIMHFVIPVSLTASFNF